MENPSRQKTEAPEAFPGHDAGRWAPVAAKVVATWPVGSFAENVAVDGDGLVFVTLHSHDRSEEHTSELQSQFHLVCRLLLEKKRHPHVGIHHPHDLPFDGPLGPAHHDTHDHALLLLAAPQLQRELLYRIPHLHSAILAYHSM